MFVALATLGISVGEAIANIGDSDDTCAARSHEMDAQIVNEMLEPKCPCW